MRPCVHPPFFCLCTNMYRNATTLGDICQLALPQESQLYVGSEFLGRAVSWACSLRPSPPAFPKLDGDELALIDLADLRRLDPKMRLDRVIHSLQSAHVTAIAVLGEVNKTAIRAAESHRIALLQIPDGHSTVQIERDIIRLIVDRDGYVAQRSAEFQRELNQTALDGGDLVRIAKSIHGFSKQPTLLLREDGELATSSGLEDLPPERHQAFLDSLPNVTALKSWVAVQKLDELNDVVGVLQLESRSSLEDDQALILGTTNGGPASRSATSTTQGEIVIAPIVASETVRGYCIILRAPNDVGTEVRPVEAIAASQGAAAAALEWAKQNAVDVAEKRMQAAFVDELLASRIADEEAWIQRGISLGYEMNRPHAAWVVHAKNIVGWPHPLLQYTQSLGVNPPISKREDGLLLFWPLDNPQSSRELKGIAHTFVEKVTESAPQAELMIGIGRPGVGPGEWHRSQQQAQESWRLGREWNGTAVTYFGDLEFYQLLTALRGNPEAARFYRRNLGKLINHDENRNSELVQTLEAFFSCHGNLSQTATRLHIHRNTLTYRLDQISEITRLDLDDPDARFSLQLALKLQPIVQHMT